MDIRPNRTGGVLFFFFLTLTFLFGAEENIPKNVLILGDSHAYALKDSFSDSFNTNIGRIDVKGISSSGLARRDFYDWIAFADSDLSDGYDLYVVILGTNDGQDSQGTEWEHFGTSQWEYLYMARVESFVTSLSQKGQVLWVSIPRSEDRHLRIKTEYIQALIDEVCRYHGVEKLDMTGQITGDLLKDDGIHFNKMGTLAVASLIEKEVKQVFTH
ncbi:MAG: hypothetical protein PQJ59_15040 [Spirochaetales bacterium]|nr:hypothetical protein [Spirochaetales bacterium]